MTWQDRYLKASYAGVPFLVDAHDWKSGRRIAVQEFPLRDLPYTEDLGRCCRHYGVRAYVITGADSDDYFPARDALANACQKPGIFTLVHPYLGRLKVRCESVALREDGEHGGQASFDLEFVESGLPPSPLAKKDTAASLLSGLASLIKLAVKVYAIASVIADRPGILLGLAEGALGELAAGFLGVSPGVFSQLVGLVGGIVGSLAGGASSATSRITGAVGDPTAVAVTDLFSAASAAVLAIPQTPVTDTVTGQPMTAIIMPPDPTYGIAGLATFGGDLPAPMGAQSPLQAELQTMVVDLVRTAAVACVATIYAGTNWTTSAAANAARAALLAMIQERLLAAAAAGQDDLYQAWLATAGLATADLVERAQSLPTLASYSLQASVPAPVLAQLLYQDGTRSGELAALNAAIHPAFMPAVGLNLQ